TASLIRLDSSRGNYVNLERARQSGYLALKFLLHFVGDIHQPLHAITHVDPDTHVEDRGGNCVGILRGNAKNPARLHAYWDTALVLRAVTKNVDAAVNELFSHITSQGEATVGARHRHGVGPRVIQLGEIEGVQGRH